MVPPPGASFDCSVVSLKYRTSPPNLRPEPPEPPRAGRASLERMGFARRVAGLDYAPTSCALKYPSAYLT
jgi:hypothetical protein